jgi:formylglycine-generating enzyme required for sulfatase activity
VAGGTFFRTFDNPGTGATGTADPATVSSFRLDEYDVTVGRFRQFVTAWKGGWTPPAGFGKLKHLNGGLGLVNAGSDAGVEYEPGWLASDDSNISPTDVNLTCASSYSTWTTSVSTNESWPINCVNWWEAYAFCIWDGAFLPSQAEWEYAAVGGTQQREYPWGSAAPGTANQFAIFGCYYPNGPTPDGGRPSCTGVGNLAPVGTPTAGAGLWGQLDLVGNVWQWSLDWGQTPYVDPCVDCAYLTPTASGRAAGGGYFEDPTPAYDNVFSLDVPASRLKGFGFRCARMP